MLNDAIDLATKTIDLLRSVKNAKMDAAIAKDQLADAILNTVELKAALASAKADLMEKDDEISRLKQIVERNKSPDYIERDGLKFQKGSDGEPTGSAFCPSCDSLQNRMVRLVNVPDFPDHTQCPACQNTYDRYQTVIGAERQWPSGSTRAKTDFDVFNV